MYLNIVFSGKLPELLVRPFGKDNKNLNLLFEVVVNQELVRRLRSLGHQLPRRRVIVVGANQSTSKARASG